MVTPEHNSEKNRSVIDEEKYRMAVEYAHDWEYWLSPDGTYVFVSPSCLRITGYCAEEFLSDPELEIKIVHPDDREMASAHRHQVLAGLQKAHQMDFRIIKKNGEERWVSHFCQPVFSKGGVWLGQRSSNRDITSRQKMEVALRESENRYRKMVDAVTTYTYSVEVREGQAVSTKHSMGCFAVTGYMPEDYEKDLFLWYSMIHPQERTVVEKAVKDIMAGHEVPPIEHRLIRRDSSIVWVRNTMVPYRDEKGQLKRYDGLVENITDRKNAEETFRTEHAFRKIIENSISAGIAVADLEGRQIYVNPSLCRMVGWTEEELTGAIPPYIYWPLEETEHISHAFEKTLKGEIPPEGFELRFQKKNSERFPVLLSISRLVDAAGRHTGWLASVTDITERKRLEEELSKARKLESVGILAGGIAHDFNNLLQAIMGNVSLAKMLVPQEEKAYKILEKAEDSYIHARDLTNQLITFAKGGAPVRRHVNIGELLRNFARPVLKGSKVTGEFLLPDDLWQVAVDEGQMRQVIQNMISNSLEAMPGGGKITISAQNVEINEPKGLPLKEGKYIKISIADQGIGIPEENMPKIFDPYFTTKEMGAQKGMGLGLSVSYSIIKKHDGIIIAHSEAGAGTTFDIYLPAC
ncbi:MAG: PAS domain S-box protein [Nitrospirae bacterium]|nr:PAS domain S-box protein [Nitrospirota bacterium]